jgi:hypothetical protein
MTTVISRLFPDQRSANSVKEQMLTRGFPRSALKVMSASDGAVADKLARAGVATDTAAAYADHVAGGKAVLVVLATYKPLCAARIAREMLAGAGTIDIGGHSEESYTKEEPVTNSSILKDHPRFLTLPVDPEDYRGRLMSREFNIPLLKPHRTKRSAISGGRFMSLKFWPMPLLKTNRKANSAIKGGRHMSARFWPQPLLTTRPRRKNVIPGGGFPLSRLFGWPTVIR